MPMEDPVRLCPMRQVTIQGLVGRKELNGSPGLILGQIDAPRERWPVRVWGNSGTVEVKVKAANLVVRRTELFERLDEAMVDEILQGPQALPTVVSALLSCSRRLATRATDTWRRRLAGLSRAHGVLVASSIHQSAQSYFWKQRYATALMETRKLQCHRAAAPDPHRFQGHDVSVEVKALRAMEDDPRQVHHFMERYEGMLGQFQPEAVRIGEALHKKGGTDLMIAVLETYLSPHMQRMGNVAWHGIGDWYM